MRIVGFLESYIKNLELTKTEIKKLLDSYNIPFVFIGGVARNAYINARTTSDVDILVSAKDKKKMINLPIGYIRCLTKDSGKRFILQDPKTEVEVIYSGEKAGDSRGIPYPQPQEVDNGHNVLTLKALVEFKLCSGLYGKRFKDYGDVQDIIRQKKLKLDYAKDFRKDLKELYEKIWKDTFDTLTID